MSEVRKNSITGEWVVFASNRHNKPYHFKQNHQMMENETIACPFCPGQEEQTPLPVAQWPKNGPWQMRVFPNKYPALAEEYEPKEPENDFYEAMDGFGIHRVVVDTPVHGQWPEEFSLDHLTRVFALIQSQVAQIQQEENIAYVQAFKNNGPMAGASVYHSHWQILGTPMVPLRQMKVQESLLRAKEAGKGCLYCAMVEEEKRQKVRLVAENDCFLAFVPFASRFPYETWIVPKRHVPTITLLTEEELEALAAMTKGLLKKIKALRPGLNYNLCLEDSPKTAHRHLFHWHLEIVPRMGSLAGFEFGCDSFINHVLPEQAAEVLRQMEEE